LLHHSLNLRHTKMKMPCHHHYYQLMMI
jgi:hypothetical protein